MRLIALVFTATLLAAPAWARQAQPSPKPETSASPQDAPPASLDKIKAALQQAPPEPLRGLDVKPTFKIEVQEHRKISLDDLLKSLDFKTGPAPGGGLYGFEMQRQVWNPVDHPLRQPYAAFSQSELLTILVENLVGQSLAGKAVSAITSAQRAHALASAQTEVRTAIAEYCAAQPNNGAGIQICSDPGR
jgi:hypothetical protein